MEITEAQNSSNVEPLSKELSISSAKIKIAVLSNYRFKKQLICADEVGYYLGDTDVSVFDKGWLTEIEIKISKSDLWQGEKRKGKKHSIYKECNEVQLKKFKVPNFFFICVPTALLEEAKKWVLTNNDKYGILEYRSGKQTGHWICRPEDMIYIAKRARPLHEQLDTNGWLKLARRLASVNISLKSQVQKEKYEHTAV